MDLARVCSVYQPAATSPDSPRGPWLDGWQAWVDRNVRPCLDDGVTCIMLHNPGWHGLGKDKSSFQFDQMLAMRAKNPRLYSEFPDVFGPLVEQGVRVIGYLGRPDASDVLVRHKHRDDRRAWLNRAVDSVAPLLAAKIDIGVDASAMLSYFSPEWKFIETLRGMGVNVWIEARPGMGDDHHHRLDWISTESTYQTQRNDPLLATDAQLKGRCLRWLDEPRWWGKGMREEIEKRQAESPRFVVGVPWEQMIH